MLLDRIITEPCDSLHALINEGIVSSTDLASLAKALSESILTCEDQDLANNLTALTKLFLTLENEDIRSVLMPLVSLPSLLSLPEDFVLKTVLDDQPKLVKKLSSLRKKHTEDSAEVSWLKSLVERCSEGLPKDSEDVFNLPIWFPSVLTFYCALLGQIPTRRFLRPQLESAMIIPRLQLLPESELIHWLINIERECVSDFLARSLDEEELEDLYQRNHEKFRNAAESLEIDEIAFSSAANLNSFDKIESLTENLEISTFQNLVSNAFGVVCHDAGREVLLNYLKEKLSEPKITKICLSVVLRGPVDFIVPKGIQFLSLPHCIRLHLMKKRNELREAIQKKSPEFSVTLSEIVSVSRPKVGESAPQTVRGKIVLQGVLKIDEWVVLIGDDMRLAMVTGQTGDSKRNEVSVEFERFSFEKDVGDGKVHIYDSFRKLQRFEANQVVDDILALEEIIDRNFFPEWLLDCYLGFGHETTNHLSLYADASSCDNGSFLGRVLYVFDDETDVYKRISKLESYQHHILLLGDHSTESEFSIESRMIKMDERRAQLLSEIRRLALCMGLEAIANDVSFSCELAFQFFRTNIMNKREELKDALIAFGEWESVLKVIHEIESLAPFELFRTNKQKEDMLLTSSRVICINRSHLSYKFNQLRTLAMSFDSVIFHSDDINEIDFLLGIALSKVPVKKITMIGGESTVYKRFKYLGFR